MTKRILLLLLICISATIATIGQTTFLDPTFADAGVARTDFNEQDDYGDVVTILPDQRILVVGYGENNGTIDFMVVRYTSDGSLDASFGDGGRVYIDFEGQDDYAGMTQLYDDGKILIGGYASNGEDFDFALARLLPDGALDASFSSDGKLSFPAGTNSDDYANALLVQPNGRILIAGQIREENNNQDFCIMRFMDDGTKDLGFGAGGIRRLDLTFGDYPEGIALQPDGKILHVGTTWYNEGGGFGDFTVLRYSSSGNLDTSFGDNGIVLVDYGEGLDFGTKVYSFGDKILVSGTSSDGDTGYDFTLLQFNQSGILDSQFGEGGRFKVDFVSEDDRVSDVIQMPDGGYLLGGGVSYEPGVNDFAAAKCTANGQLDTSFGVDGKILMDTQVNDVARSITLQEDGKIVQAGYTRADADADWDVLVMRYFGNAVTNTSNLVDDTDASIHLFPNPTSDMLYVELSAPISANRVGETTLLLMDEQGRLLQRHPIATDRLSISTRELPAGVYTVVAKTEKGMVAKTFVKE
ncbi:MAG: T9SS type A sorting domain-containing protein [Bacteroidota bacterium]